MAFSIKDVHCTVDRARVPIKCSATVLISLDQYMLYHSALIA
jgi:hypothetical protein